MKIEIKNLEYTTQFHKIALVIKTLREIDELELINKINYTDFVGLNSKETNKKLKNIVKYIR